MDFGLKKHWGRKSFIKGTNESLEWETFVQTKWSLQDGKSIWISAGVISQLMVMKECSERKIWSTSFSPSDRELTHFTFCMDRRTICDFYSNLVLELFVIFNHIYLCINPCCFLLSVMPSTFKGFSVCLSTAYLNFIISLSRMKENNLMRSKIQKKKNNFVFHVTWFHKCILLFFKKRLGYFINFKVDMTCFSMFLSLNDHLLH